MRIVSLMGDFDKANPTAQASRQDHPPRAQPDLLLHRRHVPFLRTKDDFPSSSSRYVEFQKRTKGPKPLVMDTSAIIDGRIRRRGLEEQSSTRRIVVRASSSRSSSEYAELGRQGAPQRDGRRGLERLKSLQSLPNVRRRALRGERALRRGRRPQAHRAHRARATAKLVTVDYQPGQGLRREIDPRPQRERPRPRDLREATSSRAIASCSRSCEPGRGQGAGRRLHLRTAPMVVVERARDKVGGRSAIVISSALQTRAGAHGIRQARRRAPAEAPAPAAPSSGAKSPEAAA